ncbi:sn-glycerol-1-phosphate dehydrogenase [Candidatus Nitrosocosmicus franklandus]|uniref:Glycerol-1-phosphate dehydrogenase [NAD(P)+] n=1 Tax=Candidatus Nitrosocosmicus franklandianus TaxID=1798806 RepID=A0A484IB97_9ARCH|nr:sn-glycerol-1-phosphate dehydrogenase [Candidatus Nitrosocosmicus franklandus]VFJ15043.1 Glycerol-1-phosphate dehydrogenase [NAD(P)+] [Candidatus Nitrosocosmicus franklandus]
MSYNSTHIMQLPRKVIVGNNILKNCGMFITDSISNAKKIAIMTGPRVKDKVSGLIENSLSECNLEFEWIIAQEASFQFADEITTLLKGKGISLIIGLGGGRCIDLGKLIANRLQISFISIPTSASHDGISSPFVSLKGNERPYSIMTETPLEIICDLEVISNAPYRLLASGCGDLIAKTTAVKDWELARDFNNEYFGEYAAKLAFLGSRMIIDISKEITKSEKTDEITRTIVEGLISSGVAAGIAGSSRPCSGSEHLFSHALEYITKNKCGLHGERVGIGTIIMAKLHGLDWREIRLALKRIGCPITCKDISVDKDQMIEAMFLARKIRPERFTILNKIEMSRMRYQEIFSELGILD